MKLITDINEIRDFIEKFLEITSGTLIVPGSPLRVSSAAYHRWGIGITSENLEQLKEMAEDAYLNQVPVGEERSDVERTIRPKLREWVEPRMARYMGDTVKEMLKSIGLSGDKISICEVPARDAEVSCAAAMAITFDSETAGMMQRTEFHMVDISKDSLQDTQRNMAMSGASHVLHQELDRVFLAGVAPGSIDILISLSHFHHKPFTDHLAQIHRALKDNGVLLVGDRHSAIWDHPVNAYRILQRMGAEDNTLGAFRRHFGFNGNISGDPNVTLTSEECNAIARHLQYWEEIGDAVRQLYGSKKRRVRFLEANDTSEARRQKLECAGFTTDPDMIRKAFPRSKLSELPKKILADSDFAVVMAAVKKPAPGRG